MSTEGYDPAGDMMDRFSAFMEANKKEPSPEALREIKEFLDGIKLEENMELKKTVGDRVKEIMDELSNNPVQLKKGMNRDKFVMDLSNFERKCREVGYMEAKNSPEYEKARLEQIRMHQEMLTEYAGIDWKLTRKQNE